MSVTYSCDGCKEIVDQPQTVGHVIRRQYCPACAKHANTFLDDEEAMRVNLQASFAAQRELLIQQFGANRFKLPDVPDAK